MFNFFNDIVADYGLEIDLKNGFNLVNISNKILYIEGQKGIVLISEEVMSFRIKKGVITIYGQNLMLKRITNTTLTIIGNINKIESV